MTRQTCNIYCDESCHLENDGIPVMVLGGTYARAEEVRRISRSVRDLKAEYGLATDFQVRWTKVSPGKLDFYRALIALFMNDEALRFRGVLIPDKGVLVHDRFDQDHNDRYCKMYHPMLRYVFNAPHRYQVYLDIRDTRGGHKTRHLREILCNSIHDFDQEAGGKGPAGPLARKRHPAADRPVDWRDLVREPWANRKRCQAGPNRGPEGRARPERAFPDKGVLAPKVQYPSPAGQRDA